MMKSNAWIEQNATETNVVRERRASPRRPASELPFLKSVKLLAGPEVRLIDVSRGGAQLESETPLPPGTRVCLRLVTTDTTLLIDGRVLRSRVSCLQPGLVRYRSAVAFDEEVALFSEDKAGSAAKEAVPRQEPEMQSGPPTAPVSGAADQGDAPGIVTVTAVVTEAGHDLCQIFGVNSW
jgi:hypothetical protein